MNIILKKIDFERSLHYYLKDKSYYKQTDCHMNAYTRFFDKNYKEVERRGLHFSFVTGLMLVTKNDSKYCVLHSWVEDKGMVIDTTLLSNSNLSLVNNSSNQLVYEVKKIINEHILYIPYFVISNANLTKKTQELYIKSNYNVSKFLKSFEDYLKSICDKVSQDFIFLNSIREKYGFEFNQGNFLLGFSN